MPREPSTPRNGPLPLRIDNSWSGQINLLSDAIRSYAPDRGPIRILEAGCGTQWPLNLDGVEYQLTGIDVDGDALAARMQTHGDIDEVVHADLRSADFAAGSFDVIYNAFVLEHVDGAEAVVDNFLKWLKPGGLLILRIPDRDSVFGFVTRMLPFQLHVFFKKYIARHPHAGEPGHDPFPTFYDAIVSRRGIRDYCRNHGLGIDLEVANNFYLTRLGRLRPVAAAFARTLEWLSFGRLSGAYSGLTYVLRKSTAGH